MRDCSAADVPCHRVIAAAGRLGGYGGNESLKRELLRAEGVIVGGSRVRNFEAQPLARAAPSSEPAPAERRKPLLMNRHRATPEAGGHV